MFDLPGLVPTDEPFVHLFHVTDAHLKLMFRLTIVSDGGVPQVDRKRPFGNSAIMEDVAEIADVDPDDETECRRLAAETVTALNVALQTGKFEPGWYERDRAVWTHISDEPSM